MFRIISIFLFWIKKWKIEHELIPKLGFEKFVLIGAPHTSNWDIVYFLGAIRKMKLKPNFLIKKFWMRFPFSLMFKPLGGVPINRLPKTESKGLSMVSNMVDLFAHSEKLIIAISPEGTRSKNEHWKKGFYHTALQAKIPILLGYLDYENKVAGISKAIIPSGDFTKDMMEINLFYSQYQGKNPLQFAQCQSD
ncbi:MAG: acyltransferase [Crocinitomicaceae bacterium]|nr:acyltransferase [Crocinitomicaceae bacterium]